MLINYYTFKELKAVLSATVDSDVHKWLVGKKVDRWGTGAGRVRVTAYNKTHIDEYLGFPLPEGYKGRSVNDITAIEFEIGDKVSFWQGSYKWKGTVKEVMENDTYKVHNSQIGNHNKRWFELALIGQ